MDSPQNTGHTMTSEYKDWWSDGENSDYIDEPRATKRRRQEPVVTVSVSTKGSENKFWRTSDTYNIDRDDWRLMSKWISKSKVTIPAPWWDSPRPFVENCYHLKTVEWQYLLGHFFLMYFKDLLLEEYYTKIISFIDTVCISQVYNISD